MIGLLPPLAVVGQSVPVGSDAHRMARVEDLAATDSLRPSFTLFPMMGHAGSKRPDGSSSYRLLPLESRFIHESRFRTATNTGGMLPGAGLGTLWSAGIQVDDGRISIRIQPEFITAELDSFQTYPGDSNPNNQLFFWSTYFNTVLNVVDAPERLGYRPTRRVLPGQSHVMVHLGRMSAGISTENLWWGPGIRNSLLMTDNAAGFLHGRLQTRMPLGTPIGAVEAQYVVGRLENSDLPPRAVDTGNHALFFARPRPDDHRILMGGVVAWQPVWVPGLTVGGGLTDLAYSRSLQRWHDWFPLFKPHVRLPAGTRRDPTSRGTYDRRASVFFRYVQRADQVEIYGEYGREEAAKSPTDLLETPDHTRAYVLGARKRQHLGNGLELQVTAEATQFEFTATRRYRFSPSWYTHSVIRHGYTHEGRIIGSGLGPGGGSQFGGLVLRHNRNHVGVSLERTVHNNDFYYTLFTTTYARHWVDLSVAVDARYEIGRFTLFGEWRTTRAYNYQYQEASIPGVRYIGVDRTNIRWSGGVSVRLESDQP